ncbi:MAG: 50S ribosomal protein L13 [Candidatus Vogelbacteria bacterium]|nr:50S ribosomal protein L13 [Candidatus Vogelbacteria bacterium]
MTSEHTIDANNRTIGRVASEAASVLMGKNNAKFSRNIAPKIKVTIANASKVRIPENKLIQKHYFRFSGYPGGRKGETMERVISKKGFTEIFENAVFGMLPKNRLRKSMMKNLTIAD